MGSSEAEMDLEVEREPRKRPREAEAEEEPPTADAPEPAATDPIAAAALVQIAHASRFATKTSAYYKHVLANPPTSQELREREEAWEKYRSESWERFQENFLWPVEGYPNNALSRIPCMRFTNENIRHPNYPHTVIAADTLQIISIQVNEITGGLEWPLDVYGMVAVRDVQDRRRVLVFNRKRDDYQRINEKDSYLTLTGPTRGVVMTVDPSYLEVLLQVRGGATDSEDKYLSKFVREYSLGCFNPIRYTSKFCMLEMQYCTVSGAVEATISVRVVEGQWPCGFRGLLTASTNCHSDVEIELLDLNDDVLLLDGDGFIKLSRSFVTVERGGKLNVSILQHGVGEEEEDQVSAVTSFTAAEAETSTNFMRMKIGSCWMEVKVAWSLFSLW